MRLLRREGYRVGVGESVDALQWLQFGSVPDLSLARNGLRSLVCRSYNDWQRFDALFDRYWLPGVGRDESDGATAAERIDPRLRRQRAAGTGLAHADAGDAGREESSGGGAGRQRAVTRTDFRFLTDATDRREIEMLAERLAHRLRKRLSRRRRLARRGRRIHPRRTLRASFSAGGLPIRRRFVVRRRIPPKIVVIQDISHSMAAYNPLYTHFVRGLLRLFRKTEAFVFHIELHRATNWFRERSDRALRRRLEKLSVLWMGGTRIAHSLAEFRRRYSTRFIDARTLVILLSDGYDTDEADALRGELSALKQRARQLVWLNPALEGPGEIDTDPALARLRDSVDHLLPARTLEALGHAVDVMAVRV